MEKPKSIMVWRASEKMIDILSNEYLLGGSSGASLWSIGNSEFDKECESLSPGTLTLLLASSAHGLDIVGGAYFLSWRNFSVPQTWELYGVNNGAYSYEDFVEEVKKRGGNENSTLSIALLGHTFHFDTPDYVHIPDEFVESFSQKQIFTLELDQPIGRYLHKLVLENRDNYIGIDGSDWQGMYYAASHRNSKSYVAEFEARVLHAYQNRCALSGVEARPVLKVAHIQPFYDSKFQGSSNGLVLRSDLYTLFKNGYLTFVYSQDGKQIIAKVSQTVRASSGEDYMQFDGKALLLPEDRNDWPEQKYLTWHRKNCFERWLFVGGGRA